MATNLQIEANQKNAQLSTGPVTEEGRRRSALNSVRHGFTGQSVVLTAEEAEPYREFNEQYLKDLAPVGAQEQQLSRSIIDARWRVNQLNTTESGIYALGHREYIDQFQQEAPALAISMARALTFKNNQKELDRLHRYESRLFRQATRDEATLKALQAERKAHAEAQEKEAIKFLTMYGDGPWNPSDFGFVWSIEEIKRMSVISLEHRIAQDNHVNFFKRHKCPLVPAA
jgi:hypothetical protein